jgi:hypothetical protein
MPRGRKKMEDKDQEILDENQESLDQKLEEKLTPTIHDIEWTDYVLSFLTEDEKIMGNPTTDGLRRIFEKVMDSEIMEATTKVDQTPSRDNEMRATVTFSLIFKSNKETESRLGIYNSKLVTGAADVYWGNCDKVFRNHPVAVAETRAEGRALRRALRLRKVVAAEEVASEIEDHPDAINVSKITNNQINFIDVMAKRLDINVKKMLNQILDIKEENVYNIEYEDAVKVASVLAEYQQKDNAPEEILGFDANWR